MPHPSPSNADSLNSQLPTARKEWRPATAGSSPHAVTCQHCDTHYFSRPRSHNLPIVGWLLVRRATSSATDSPMNPQIALVCLCMCLFVCPRYTSTAFDYYFTSIKPTFFGINNDISRKEEAADVSRNCKLHENVRGLMVFHLQSGWQFTTTLYT